MEEIIKLVSEFGAIGLAALLGYAYFKTVTNHMHETRDAIRDSSNSNKELTVAITKLTEFLEIKLK
jgi:hypothetical protein